MEHGSRFKPEPGGDANRKQLPLVVAPPALSPGIGRYPGDKRPIICRSRHYSGGEFATDQSAEHVGQGHEDVPPSPILGRQ